MNLLETKTDLMDHQRHAVAKMMATRSGALLMDMGTGKTRTAIELVKLRQHKISRVVWFAPVSVKQTIRNEIITHCGSFDPKLWHIYGTESISGSIRITDEVSQLIDSKTFIVLDESHFIKNWWSNRASRIIKMSANARYKLILTGTMVTVNIKDAFSQFYFLSPKILGYNSFNAFACQHLEYHKKQKGRIVATHNIDYFAAKVEPYIYQVTKDECLDLPPKIYKSYYFNMSDAQRKHYDLVKEIFFTNYSQDCNADIFVLFTQLQEVVCGFLNTKNEALTFENTRIELLSDVISDIPMCKKVVIWCKYRYDIESIRASLPDGSFSVISGDVPIGSREIELKKFKNDRRFLIATEGVGGHGITLNEADYCIFYNNSFKYADRIQAEDRSHRIGQTKSVIYLDLVCNDSIDILISRNLSKKGRLIYDLVKKINSVKDKYKLKKYLDKL